LGLDLSPSLIKEAQKLSRHEFKVANVSKPLPSPSRKFSHAAVILALQNIEHPETALKNASAYLVPGGRLLIVLNHPCFRIPRQSSWGIDPQNKLEYRRINRYLSPLKIPVTTNPGNPNSAVTWSFHNSLSSYFQFLKNSGFVITDLEEWASDKASVGRTAKMENRARSEFPLFLAILAKKEI
jgi:ubiquinone/menaquinone biosynthesis C-methylase UbiE